jgi:AcrR family transcriptional regulator
MGRRRVHGEQTRLALLGAAELLVARDGVAALSVRSVAEAVGTSTRAVYSVFGSKEALVRGLATHAFELLMQAVDATPLTEDPVADLQAALVSGFRPYAVKHPDLFRLALVWSPVTPDAGVFEASETAFSRLELRVERVRAAGLLSDRSTREVAFELAAVSNALANLEVCGTPPDVDADRIWNHTVGDVLRGLCGGGREHQQPGGV